MSSSASDTRIGYFAYLIWESEGRPNGQAQRHWEMAGRLAAAEAKANQVFAKPATRRKSSSPSSL